MAARLGARGRGPRPRRPQRGFDSGGFRWRVEGTRVVGGLAGITNAGTHRGPIIQECQRYHHPGFMEGRFCGAVEDTEERPRGRRLFGTYRLRIGERSGEGLSEQELAGIREGAEFVCECRG